MVGELPLYSMVRECGEKSPGQARAACSPVMKAVAGGEEYCQRDLAAWPVLFVSIRFYLSV